MSNGSFNVAIGSFAGLKFAGNSNIAVGYQAGQGVTGPGSNNILIGHQGTKNDDSVIRIGTRQKQTFIAGISQSAVTGGVAVMVNSKGQLGVTLSSARFKQDIQPMGEASTAVLSLQPVTFHYQKQLDPDSNQQFGLVAEEVAKVRPDLVIRDDSGQPLTVRYDAINAMLLNEFLKAHRQLEAQQNQIAELKATLKIQGEQLQKVSAWVETNAPQLGVVSTAP
jgi:hypothetical protein